MGTKKSARHRALSKVNKCGNFASHIRDWVNDGNGGAVKEKLLNDNRKWLPVCVSMDILEDSLEAVQYYLRYGLARERKSEIYRIKQNVGGKYLRLYGVLQALLLNQDAIANLHLCLIGKKFIWKKESAWNRVRRLRVCIAGHPHDADQEGPSFLSRPALGPRGFSYHSYMNHKEMKAEDIDLDLIIDEYFAEASEVLSAMVLRFPLKRQSFSGGLVGKLSAN
jgi:hypothetical protein